MEYKYVNTNTHRSDREENVTMTTNRTERNGTQANRINFTCRKFVFIWIYKNCRCIYERFKFFKLHEMSVIIACESIREVIIPFIASFHLLFTWKIYWVCVCVSLFSNREEWSMVRLALLFDQEKNPYAKRIFSHSLHFRTHSIFGVFESKRHEDIIIHVTFLPIMRWLIFESHSIRGTP